MSSDSCLSCSQRRINSERVFQLVNPPPPSTPERESRDQHAEKHRDVFGSPKYFNGDDVIMDARPTCLRVRRAPVRAVYGQNKNGPLRPI